MYAVHANSYLTLCAFIHPLIHSPSVPSIHRLLFHPSIPFCSIHPLIHSRSVPFIHSLLFHPSTPLLFHPFILLLFHPSIPLLFRPSIHLLFHPSINSSIEIRSPTRCHTTVVDHADTVSWNTILSKTFVVSTYHLWRVSRLLRTRYHPIITFLFHMTKALCLQLPIKIFTRTSKKSQIVETRVVSSLRCDMWLLVYRVWHSHKMDNEVKNTWYRAPNAWNKPWLEKHKLKSFWTSCRELYSTFVSVLYVSIDGLTA